MDQRDAIDKVLAASMQKDARCVNAMSEILPMLQSVQLPDGGDFMLDSAGRLVDPSGIPYVLDNERCRVTLDSERTGIPQK